jgi:transcription termination/antitermination protein NusG
MIDTEQQNDTVLEEKYKWYAIHTKPNFEDKVAINLRQRIEQFNLQEKIMEIFIPKITEIVIKNGRKRKVEKKLYPTYVLVKIDIDPQTWFIIRNTPDVTGFLGTGNTPVAIPENEIAKLKNQEVEKLQEAFKIDFIIGEPVIINDGPFKGYEANVSSFDEKSGKVTVTLSFFGRETPLELDALQLKKLKT